MFKIFKKDIHPQIKLLGEDLKISHLMAESDRKMVNWNGKMVPEPVAFPIELADGSIIKLKRFKFQDYRIETEILYDHKGDVENIPFILSHIKKVNLKKNNAEIALTNDEQKFLHKKIEIILRQPQSNNNNRNILDEDFDENDWGNCKTGLPPAPPMPNKIIIDPPEKEIRG